MDQLTMAPATQNSPEPVRGLSYLSDAISDLALEIDHYTKENIRIALFVYLSSSTWKI